VTVVGPADGPLTGGDSGPGRLSEPDEIVSAALSVVSRASSETDDTAEEARVGDLEGVRLVVSAGGTREPLDPVRFIGNRSTGKQGAAIALAAARRGAIVTVVAAELDGAVLRTIAAVPGVRVLPVSTALELETAMRVEAATNDVVVMTAAVADYRPAEVSAGKIKKDDTGDEMVVRLVRNPDVLAGLVAERRVGQTVVGFAAETTDDRDVLVTLGRTKQVRKGADLLVLNSVGWSSGFGSDDTAVVVIDRDGSEVAEARGTKHEVADALLDAIAARRAV
jgi:phosphopantothenoylcysteine decarboxylase/phosphopantothenate--cysteine ligase